MKVALFIKGINGIVGGAERSILDLAGGLAANGFVVEVVSLDKEKGAPFYDVPNGVRLVNINPKAKEPVGGQSSSKSKKSLPKKVPGQVSQLKNKLLILSSGLRALQRLKRQRKVVRAIDVYAQNAKPDLVIAFMNGMGIPVAMSKALAKVPKVFSFRKTPEYEFKFDLPGSNLHLSGLHLRDVLRSYNAITVLVPDYREVLPANLRKRVKYIPNPIKPTNTLEAARGLTERPKKIVFVGRLIASKRPLDLLKAWESISDQFPDWSVNFVGNGSQAQELREYVESNGLTKSIEFLGVQDDVQHCLREAQVLCFPSQFEGFPRALGEAMEAGLACIGYDDCDGVAHLLKDGGVLANAEQGADDLANKLACVLRDKQFREQLGQKAANTAKLYHPDTITSSWVELIRALKA